MAVKVIGAGFGRTGTASLKAALEELGFGPCYHMTEVFANPEHVDFWLAAWRGEARGFLAGRVAGRVGPLGGGSRKLRGERGLAGLHVLRAACGETPRCEGAPERARPREVVREHPPNHLQGKQS